MKDKLKNFEHKLAALFAALSAILLENANDVMGYVQGAMPQLQDYLPANPYKTLGVLLVVGGLLLHMHTHSAGKGKGGDQ